MSQSVSYINSLTGSEIRTELDDLVGDLSDEYDADIDAGKNYYEIFNMVDREWKLHFDFDKKLEMGDEKKFNVKEYTDKIMSKLNFVFDTEIDEWAISEDCRVVKIKGKKFYKLSFHYISTTKKTTYDYLHPKIKDIYKIFNADGIPFDTSIYRKGITRFRIVLCKKDNEIKSLLKPTTYKDDIKKHIIQNIYGCEDLWIPDDKISLIKNSINSETSKKDIIKGYEIVSTSIKKGVKYHNIKGECPFAKVIHEHNHFYITEKSDSLEIRCHSKQCVDKIRVLYRKNTDFNLFDVDFFNSIRIPEGKSDNYIDKKKYFEEHYIYIRNTNTMYNVIYRKSSMGYYERELMEIKDKGLESYNYQKKVEDKPPIEDENFHKTYRYDQHRKNYLYADFIPKDKIDKGIYNLFTGFNYQNVLGEDDEITDNDLEELDILLNHLKVNVCEDDDKIFDYFISSLAMILQHPTFLTHIITVFYSSEEGTGKSSFLKFFSKVIGELYAFFGSVKDITEKHSTSAVGRLINVIEELKSNKDETELLKNYSQRERAPINDKNKSISNISCYVRYFIASNLRKCLSLKKGERRYLILKFTKILDKEYVNKLESIYKNRKIIYLFGNYLMNYKIEEKKLKRKWWEDNKPITKTYKMFINNDNLCSFMRDMYARIDFFDGYRGEELIMRQKKGVISLTNMELWDLYRKYMAHNENTKYTGKREEFYKKISEDHSLYVISKIPSGVKKYYINLSEMKKHFDIDGDYVNRYTKDYKTPSDSDDEVSDNEDSDSDSDSN